jgi:hypothetical protein
MSLGFAAGILIILNAGAWLLVGNIWEDPAPFALYSVVATGMIFGLIVIFGAYMLKKAPEEKMTWGAIIALFSVFGLVTVGGGWVAGFALGIISGAIAAREGKVGR